MKTLNKLKMFVKMAVITCSLSIQAQAQTPTTSPDDIRDGVVNVIDAKQITDLLVWARSSKTDLEDGLKKITELPRSERHQALSDLITDIVGTSGDLTTELLMRSVLKRAKNLNAILAQAPKSPERETLAIRLLTDSASWAVRLYQSDEDFLKRASDKNSANKTKNIPIDLDFTSLGINHGKYILDNLWLSPSLITRIELVKESLSYFYNDLNRDNVARRNTVIANVLMKVANFAQKMGLDKVTSEYLKSIEGLPDLEKQNLTRKIEAFYKEQLDKAASVRIDRISSEIGTPSSAGCCSSDSVLNAKFVYVRPGKFLMGSPNSEAGRSSDEQQHEVTLTRGFAIQVTDVTQSQWYNIMGNNPSKFTSSADCPDQKVVSGTAMCPNNPVEQVFWNDVQEFIKTLNQKAGANVYRLPTEAEWEYAARGGQNQPVTPTAYSFGDDSSLLSDYAWYYGNSGGKTHPVCTRKPNPLGLCDMHGNVYQWVQDLYAEYGSSPVTDPLGQSGWYRSFRGGGWNYHARRLRSAYRGYGVPALRNSNVGLRLVRASN